jgi:hypothetical protein
MALRQNSSGVSSDLRPATSTDGVHWQAVTNVPGMYSIAFANGQFDANVGTTIWGSGDGGTWVGTNAAPAFHGFQLHSAGDALFEFAPADLGVQQAGGFWQRVSTGDFLSTPLAVAASADRFVGVSRNGWIATSADGVHWATQVEGAYGELRAIDYVDGQFVALSTLNHLMRSADGVHWTPATLLAGQDAQSLLPMAIVHAAHTVVAVGLTSDYYSGAGGGNGLWARSLDGGTTWAKAATTGPAEPMLGVAWDGHRFLSISASGKVYSSPDGDAWGQVGTAPSPLSQYMGLAYGGGTWLAFGDGVVATSPDGVTWTPIPANTLGVPTSQARVNAAVWTGDRFILVGTAIQSGTNYPQSISAASTDGQSWTVGNIVVGTAPYALATCGNETVGVGSDALISTTDGLTWHGHGAVTDARQLEAAACGSDRFVAVGSGSAIVTSSR